MTPISRLLFGLTVGLVLTPWLASAQEADTYWQCKTSSPPGWCPATLANPLPVTGTFTGTVTANSAATATAAAPSYSEGISNPLSQTLAGALRTIITAGTAVIGHVITDTGSTTAVTGTVTITGSGTAGSSAAGVVSVQGIASGTALPVSGTFFQATQPVSIASGGIASGALASGAYASGSIASGAVASGAYASGAYASGSVSDGAVVTLGAKADARSTATDATAITVMQVLKEISFMAQTPAALPANQSVNLAQVAGATAAVDNGIHSTGTPRVTIADQGVGEYETVAASQTAQTLGATGAAGDYLLQVVCAPATTSPGVVTVLDNASAIVSFAGGASSVSNLLPFTIPVNAYSTSGAWKVTTGTNVSCVGVGNFT